MAETMPSPSNTASSSDHQETQNTKETLSGQMKSQKPSASPNTQKPQKSRHRASVACASCRERRIRCVVPPGETSCTQCKRSNVQCIIKNDDERRRPISRAYVCSLTERITLLESMLKERGEQPPPANHPPKTRHDLSQDGDEYLSPGGETIKNTGLQSDLGPESHHSPQHEITGDREYRNQNSPIGEGDSAGSPSMLPPPKKDGMVSRLLSTRGHLSFDQLNGRLRYFGPTTNCHVHSEIENPVDTSKEGSQQARRAEKVIRSLPSETHGYLMDLFWQCYNSVVHVLHQEAFTEDREAGRSQYYSGFLQVCVLAMGFRFADKQRPDMQNIALSKMESTLHREAKNMLDYELERPGGVTSVVALLLLGDLECGVGRDNLGWLYAGLAMRLAIDIGLHLDTRLSGLGEREMEIRHMTLWACVIYDKYWALYLGRPTSMKSADLEIYTLSKHFERLGACQPAGPEKSTETSIYEALIDLMDLAGRISENMDPHSQQSGSASAADRTQYLRMAALDREFSNWYARLPEQLRWTPTNIANAPFSFFLLHQQYHCSLILLHRPFAMYEDEGDKDEGRGSSPGNHFSALSRTVCTKHAIRVARIFWQHRQRFDTTRIFITGLQHAGTAATALVAALAFLKDPADRSNNMQYLECLAAALQDMAHTYQPAERMSGVLRAVMIELRGGTPTDPTNIRLYKSPSSVVPARRGSTTDAAEMPTFKKRQLSMKRPIKNSRSMSMNTGAVNTRGQEFHIKIEPPSAYGFESSLDTDGFVMITPQLEMSSWAALDTPGPHMDQQNYFQHMPSMSPLPSISTLPNPTTSMKIEPSASHPNNNNNNNNAWLGAELDTADTISHLANIHFPEIPTLHETDNTSQSHLDFMSLGGESMGNGEWGSLPTRDWLPQPGNQNMGVGSDIDGFPPQRNLFGMRNAFGMGYDPGEGRFGET